ncbi:MAG TPA: 16S rRNA (cytosine(1402)-N(4))-methyltransferase [Lentisphaeria bacterium]|nr:MAG: 16S rRNA (cytosine(1402)-N(4))-methyltransferase [Lentisphaerae bacterium GWF2_38_69]HBM14986.1 16S rRNA (cytosine(1402)-N(4))-methyltransferase [Lentisphaeria bacterium]
MDQEQLNIRHTPVMLHEVLEHLIPAEGNIRVIDGTLGFGGHCEAILKHNSAAIVLGLDRDSEAIESSQHRFGMMEDRVIIHKAKFSEMSDVAYAIGWEKVDAILLDIGVSSVQIDEGYRGFSFRKNGPLDMRMDASQDTTAAKILNRKSIEELTAIFRNYGEIDGAMKLARAIVSRRTTRSWASTEEFSQLCEDVVPSPRRNAPPVSTLCFQALRIAVNDELIQLEKAVEKGISILNKGGRIGVISYHSLEDRIVKNIFRRESTDCLCSKKLPICRCGHKASIKLVTKKPLEPSQTEIINNRRAAAAKFRIAEKIT